FKEAGKKAGQQAAGDVAQEPGESLDESADRRHLTTDQVHADDLEDIVGMLLSFQVVEFAGIEIDIDQTDELAGGIDDRKGQEAMQDEELASLQNSGIVGQLDDIFHHQVFERRLRIGKNQAADGHYADQAVTLVSDVEVD